MNQSANKIFRHFAGNRSLLETSVEKLKTFSAAYPYFAVAQFFLAKKLRDEEDDTYMAQSQKAVLYFTNPFLFDHLLNTELLTGSAIGEPEESIHYDSEGGDEPVAGETTSASNSEEEESDIMHESVQHLETPTLQNEMSESKDVETIAKLETKQSLATDFELQCAENVVESGAIQKTNLPPVNIEEPDEHEKMFRSIKAMLDASSEEANADVDNTNIAIDPYYTIDYFASQGIQLDLDNPQDKLGQNLKRFTQWLRHMKKLGPEDAKNEIENTTSEADIQKLADTSNTVKEVVTEAMASVLEKQGKKGKAIELYTKLSFLNPDKSAYFAAQIEKLKGF